MKKFTAQVHCLPGDKVYELKDNTLLTYTCFNVEYNRNARGEHHTTYRLQTENLMSMIDAHEEEFTAGIYSTDPNDLIQAAVAKLEEQKSQLLSITTNIN